MDEGPLGSVGLATAPSSVSEKSGLFEALHGLAKFEIESAPVLSELRLNRLLFVEAPKLLAATRG